MFDQVSIIGCGLIGSSVLRRLKKNKSSKKKVKVAENMFKATIAESAQAAHANGFQDRRQLQQLNVKIMSVEDHDKIISLTSHLPHAIAYNIVKTVMASDEKAKADIVRYSAGGLRDFTRIAASDPIMWKDIFINNSSLIIDAIDRFSQSLNEFKKAIEEKNSEKLLKIFEKSKEFRKSIIKAGQDTDKPDFGRK